MKKNLQIAALCAVVFGFAVSCGPDEATGELAAPTGLTAGTVTQAAATLSWNAVEGAEKYRVSIDAGTPAEVASTSYEASGLAADTKYIWKVQAVKGDAESAWSETAIFTTLEEDSALPRPTDLAVSGVTDHRAAFSWSYDGTADYYALVIGGNEELLVTSSGYHVAWLEPETEYTWKVRAHAGGEWSRWSEGKAFTTGADGVEFIYSHQPIFWNNRLSQSTSWFWLNFFTFNFQGSGIDVTEFDGWQIGMDVISVLADRSADREYIDIPEGKYTFSNKAASNMVYIGENTALVEMEDGQPTDFPAITGGTMTVEGDHTGYVMTINATLSGGRTFTAYYTGEILLKNPYYVKPSGKTVELGDFTGIAQFDYVPDARGNGTVDGWLIRVHQPDIYMDGVTGRFKGNGWTCDMQIVAPISSGPIIPDHEYTIDRSNRPWTSLGGNGTNGLNIRNLELGVTLYTQWLSLGKVTTAYSGGSYKIDVEAIAYGSGDLYKFSIKATPPTAAPIVGEMLFMN